jgi:hypothetical protein
MRFRFRLPALIAAAVVIPLGLSGPVAAAHPTANEAKAEPAALTAAQVSQLAAHATDRSIIIFKNQLSNLPARGATAALRVSAAKAVQAPVMAELTALHATNVQSFQLVNAIAATISSAEVQRLKANPAIASVVPDTLEHLTSQLSASPSAGTSAADTAATTAAAAGDTADQQLCPSNPAKPLIEPESRGLMNVNAANQIADGSGIKVGLLYDGFDPNNPDLIRANGQHVVYDYQDFSGQGPSTPSSGFAIDLAGLISAQGNQVYDLSKYVNKAHPLPAGCNIKLVGVAPGASLAEMNWGGDDANQVYNSQIYKTVQYAVMTDHVNVLVMPFGGTAIPNFQNDPPTLLIRAAIAAGVVVVAPTGDTGPTSAGNIFSPGGVPGVIGVGASTAFQYDRQTDQNGPNAGSATGWVNNNISAQSGSGIQEYTTHTLDVVAPGDAVWGLCSTDTARFFACTDPDNGSSPGIAAVASTAFASSEVSGVAALVMQAYAKTHNGTMPAPALVQRIIDSSATDLGAPADEQGAGLVNALKAVQLAESVNGGSPQGSTLLASKTQLNATVNAGQSQTFSIGVINEGKSPQTVSPTVSGNPTTVSTDTGTVTLSASSPTSVGPTGETDSYAKHTFTVPAGTDYLNGNIAWNDQVTGGTAYEELFDPQGKLAAFASADGNQSGYGHVEVSKPAAGTWTAIIWTPSTAKYFGPVQFSYTTEDFHTAGSVSPASVTLGPGQEGVFHVRVTAGQPGDESFSLHLGTGSSTDGTIPITLRALVPVSGGSGSFAGTLTGDAVSGTTDGGGPATGTAGGGQEFTYQFYVPPGEPALNVGIQLRDSDYILQGAIIPPFEQGLDLQSTANNANGPGATMQFYRRTPVPGLWTVSFVTTGAIDGAHLTEPFTGTVSFKAPAVTASGLPDSATTTLPAGQPVTATITVANPGNIAKDYFADPRLNQQAQLTLLGTNTVGGTSFTDAPLTVAQPVPGNANPHFLVPTDTTRLVTTAQGTLPLTMDMNSDDNDPEEQAVSSGNNAVATLVTPEASPGQEWVGIDPAGPFSGPVSGTAKLTMVATANAFDSAITSSTGDAWQLAVNAKAPYTPLTLAPGQSGTITLTITPNAPKGTVVRGFIAVDTFNKATSSGDEIINIPYSYTVG